MYLRYMTAHVRVNTSITCYAGYFAVHLLRKYTTMLGFLPHYKERLLKVSLQKANKRVTTSVLFRARARNLSKYQSFRYSSAITGGTCRSLSLVTSVRCSKAIFQMHSIHPSQPGHFRGSELFCFPARRMFSENFLQMYSLSHCLFMSIPDM